MLECHVKNRPAINHTKSVLLLEENEYVNFQNFERLIIEPFITYGNFECVLTPSIDNFNFGRNTKIKYCIVCSYEYKLICIDDRYSKPYKTYFGEDAIIIFK